MIRYVVTVFAVLLLLNTRTEGKHITGVLTSRDNWKFVSRFCFRSEVGTLQFTFSYPRKYLTQSLLLYWDNPNLWQKAYSNSSMTCDQKEALLDISKYQIFRLNPETGFCSYMNNNSVTCTSNPLQFKSSRDRWWFLAISNCRSTEGLSLQYDMRMKNGNWDDFFRAEFSADELYILEFNIAFFFIELLMLAFVAYVSAQLVKMQMFHSTYKIFLASVVFFYASIIITCIAFISYASSGIENTGLKILSTILYAISQILLILMLLLLGLGYTVVCGRLPHWAVICLSVFVSLFAITYIALYVVEAATFDPGLVLYRWESPPGYGLMAIILAAWLFFLGCCAFSIAKHKKKAAFYAPMMIFYSLWFIAIPITVGINMSFVEDFTRAKVVNFVEVIILFLAHVFYLVLTWPNLANKNFPFHIKTTQIDVITFEAAAADAEEEEANAKGGDFANGGMFTDFSIFTVADQRDSYVQRPITRLNATSDFGVGLHSGDFNARDFAVPGTDSIDSGTASLSRGDGGQRDADSVGGGGGGSGGSGGDEPLVEGDGDHTVEHPLDEDNAGPYGGGEGENDNSAAAEPTVAEFVTPAWMAPAVGDDSSRRRGGGGFLPPI